MKHPLGVKIDKNKLLSNVSIKLSNVSITHPQRDTYNNYKKNINCDI